MAMAASMVIPTNLVAMSTVATPVLATEDRLAQIFGVEPVIENGVSVYSLNENQKIEVNQSIYILTNQKVKILLNGATISSSGYDVFMLYPSAELEIEGPGTLENTSPIFGTSCIYIPYLNSKLTIDKEVTLKSTQKSGNAFNYAIFLDAKAKDAEGEYLNQNNSEVTISNSTIEVFGGGLYVQGNIHSGSPKITLDNVNIKALPPENYGSTGIYQAGDSDILIKGKSEISGSSRGIETRGGNLTIQEKSKIIGGQTNATELVSYGNGNAVMNVGIGITQHNTKLPINVNIEDSDIFGYTALVVANPEDNNTKKDPQLKKCYSNSQ